jgi:hypothetical protein
MPNNVISNRGSPPNPNVWWQPTAAAPAPVAYDVNLGQPTAGSAATTTWYPAYFPSAYEVDTSPDGVTWSTLSFSSNTASRTDVFPSGQVTARYLRLPITAFQAAAQRLQRGPGGTSWWQRSATPPPARRTVFRPQTNVRYVQYVLTS